MDRRRNELVTLLTVLIFVGTLVAVSLTSGIVIALVLIGIFAATAVGATTVLSLFDYGYGSFALALLVLLVALLCFLLLAYHG